MKCSFSDPPAMLAEEAGDEVLELAFVARAKGVRIGKWGGHDFTLAALTANSRPALFCTVQARKRNSTNFLTRGDRADAQGLAGAARSGADLWQKRAQKPRQKLTQRSGRFCDFSILII
jgi:hypothetical protein